MKKKETTCRKVLSVIKDGEEIGSIRSTIVWNYITNRVWDAEALVTYETAKTCDELPFKITPHGIDVSSFTDKEMSEFVNVMIAYVQPKEK